MESVGRLVGGRRCGQSHSPAVTAPRFSISTCKLKDACMAQSPADILLNTSPRSATAPYHWPPQPEERRSRAPEFYGFVAWTSTYLLFVLYILWAVLPDEWIVWMGVTWYPNRYDSQRWFRQRSFLADFFSSLVENGPFLSPRGLSWSSS